MVNILVWYIEGGERQNDESGQTYHNSMLVSLQFVKIQHQIELVSLDILMGKLCFSLNQ